MLNEGEDAPDFALPDQDGDTVELSDYRGETVVLYFYPKADTPGCTAQACSFRDAYDEFEERGVTVLGISTDTVADIAAFAEKHDLPFTLLADENGEVARDYDSFAVKEMRGEEWEIAQRNTYVIGPDGTIQAVYEGVSPEGYAEEILGELDAMAV